VTLTREKAASIACVGVMLALAVTLGFVRDLSGDFHWHLVLGRKVLEGSLPNVDTFSHTFAGKPAFITTWLADAMLALAFQIKGMTGAFVLKAACTALMFGVTCREMVRIGLPAWAAAPPLVLAMPWLTHRLVLRPEMFAFAALAVLLHLLGEHERGPRRWHLPAALALIALWANLHGSVSIGLFALGLFAAEQLVRQRHDRRRALTYLVLPVLALAAACLNPEGIRTPMAFRIMSPTWVKVTIEWQPLDWGDLYLAVRVLAIVVGVSTLIAIRRTSPWRCLLVLMLVGQTLRYERIATFTFLAAMPLLARNLVVIGESVVPASRSRTWRAGLAAAAAFVMGAGLWDLAFEHRLVRQLGADSGWYPEAACRFAHEARFEGKMLNSFDFGSYLMYCLPESPVFIDQRAWFVYPDSFIKRLLDAAATPAGLRQLADETGVTWAFVKYDPIAIQMGRDRETWHLVYFDDLALIFVRDEAASSVTPFRFIGPDQAVTLAHLEGDDLIAARAELAEQERRCPGCGSTALVEAALAVAGREGDEKAYEAAKAYFDARSAMQRQAWTAAASLARRYVELGGNAVAGEILRAEALARGGDKEAAWRILDDVAKMPGGAEPASQASGRFL
jgi:hypothetical protein